MQLHLSQTPPGHELSAAWVVGQALLGEPSGTANACLWLPLTSYASADPSAAWSGVSARAGCVCARSWEVSDIGDVLIDYQGLEEWVVMFWLQENVVVVPTLTWSSCPGKGASCRPTSKTLHHNTYIEIGHTQAMLSDSNDDSYMLSWSLRHMNDGIGHRR